jgi:peptide/nickel transport system substrate-binding protein
MNMRRFLLLLLSLCLASCARAPEAKGYLLTAGDWVMPPAYHGNPWAPGGVGVARSYVYDPLFDFVPQTDQWLPRLGERFEESADGRSLTVHLRGDARWHDGHPFSARDVEATFTIGFLKGLEVWHYLERIEIVDDLTVVFHWKRLSPTNTMLALTEPIVSAEHLSQPFLDTLRDLEHEDGQRDLDQESARRELLFAERPALPVGTGPFRLTKTTSSDMVLEKFEQYHDAANVHLKGVRIARWGRNEAVWSYLYAGQLDAISPACPWDVAQEVLRKNPNVQMRTPSDMNEMGLVINCREEPLSALDFRKALAHALDRDSIRRLACEPGDTSPGYNLGMVPSLADQWLGPGFAEGLEHYDFDPVKAKALFQEHESRRPLEIMAPAGFTDLALLAESAASQLTKLGINAHVRLIPGDLYAVLMRDGKFDIAAVFGAQMGRTIHPATSNGRYFSRDAQLQTASGLPLDTEAVAWVEQLRLERDMEKARELAQKLARRHNETVSFIPCFEKRLLVFVQDGTRVTGWPAADSPLWSAAPLGVENMYTSMIVHGHLRPAP